MNREQKAQEIERIRDKFARSQIVLLTDYKGLKVNEVNQLRQKLRQHQSTLRVTKNRLARIALKGGKFESLSSHFMGTTAVIASEGDPVGPAKVLVDFSKEHEAIQLKVSLVNGVEISRHQLMALAQLPSRGVLLSQLCGSMLLPARNWVMVLAGIPRQLLNVLVSIKEKKEGGSSVEIVR